MYDAKHILSFVLLFVHTQREISLLFGLLLLQVVDVPSSHLLPRLPYPLSLSEAHISEKLSKMICFMYYKMYKFLILICSHSYPFLFLTILFCLVG